MAATNPQPAASPTSPQSALTDLVIIGGGPAALSAALYAARAGLKTQVFERAGIGGALAEISHISNYPGYDGPGPELAAEMRRQAAQAGAEIIYGDCQKLWRHSDYFELTLDADSSPDAQPASVLPDALDAAPKILAKKVLIATGSTPKKLSFTPRPPVSYCALCDGDLAKGKHVAVIGGANSAVQESLYLAALVKDLTIITHSRLKADSYLQQRLAAAQKSHTIRVLENTEATPELLDAFDYIFVFIGKLPATSFLRPLADSPLANSLPTDSPLANSLPAGGRLLDPSGYVLTAAGSHATAVSGLYAAGDVRSSSLKQVVTAAADGAAAAIEIAHAFNLPTPA